MMPLDVVVAVEIAALEEALAAETFGEAILLDAQDADTMAISALVFGPTAP
jgi:hypothetical protein